MKKQILTASFVLFYFILPFKTLAANFNQIFVFGDSLSDTGNSFDATQSPPSPPYYRGRSSNGPLWVEYLASDLALGSDQATNFAFGGATTGTDNISNPNLPGLIQQLNGFTAANSKADPNTLYVIWAGANDYLGNNVTDPNIPVTNLANAVNLLAKVGAKYVLVANLPDLGNLPSTLGNNQISSLLSTLTTSHNSNLSTTLASSSQELGINVILLDVNSLFNRILATPEEFSFANVTDSCLNLSDLTACFNPNKYLFWDNFHPTTAVHKLIAELALSDLKSVLVPENSTVLGVFVIGTLGMYSMLKRKQKMVVLQKHRR